MPRPTAGRLGTGQPLALTSAPTLDGDLVSRRQAVHGCRVERLGPAGVVLTTRNAGSTWDEVPPPAGAIVVTSVACTSATDCTAIASDGTTFWSAHSTDFGHTWERGGALPAGLQDAGGLSCLGGQPLPGERVHRRRQPDMDRAPSRSAPTAGRRGPPPTYPPAPGCCRVRSASPSRPALPPARPRPRSAPSSRPRVLCSRATTGDGPGRGRRARARSMTSSRSPARHRASAPWWAPGGSARHPSAPAPWPCAGGEERLLGLADRLHAASADRARLPHRPALHRRRRRHARADRAHRHRHRHRHADLAGPGPTPDLDDRQVDAPAVAHRTPLRALSRATWPSAPRGLWPAPDLLPG